MSNPKGNPATLEQYTPKWKHGKTRTIRVPIALADEILDYAHQLDEGKIATQDQDAKPQETLTQVNDSLE